MAETNFKELSIKILEDNYTWMSQDIYLKVNDQKYIKIHAKENILDKDDIEKFKKKKIDAVYLTPKDYDEFNLKLTQSKDSGSVQLINIEQALAVAGTFNQVKETAYKMGVEEEVIEKVDKIGRAGHDLMNKNTKLSSLLKIRDESFSKAHSLLMATIVSSAVYKYPDQAMLINPEKIMQMMSQASFLHNMSLTDDELIQSIDPNKTELARKIKFHPVEAAEYVNLINQASPEMTVVILQHHENCHGSGYPYKLKMAKITPLSALFITCNRLTDRLISTQCDRENIVASMKYIQDFQIEGKIFQTAFEALRAVFLI